MDTKNLNDAEVEAGPKIPVGNARPMIPTIGRIVHYRLTKDNAIAINRRRTTSKSIAERMAIQVSTNDSVVDGWPAGAQAHIGNEVREGQTFPMMIVAVWGKEETSCVNGQVFLDGCDVLWALSVKVGEGPGTWSWPERA